MRTPNGLSPKGIMAAAMDKRIYSSARSSSNIDSKYVEVDAERLNDVDGEWEWSRRSHPHPVEGWVTMADCLVCLEGENWSSELSEDCWEHGTRRKASRWGNRQPCFWWTGVLMERCVSRFCRRWWIHPSMRSTHWDRPMSRSSRRSNERIINWSKLSRWIEISMALSRCYQVSF